MRRLAFTLALAALGLLAGALTAHALHAQGRIYRATEPQPPGTSWNYVGDTVANTAASGWDWRVLPDSTVPGFGRADSTWAAMGCERRDLRANDARPLYTTLFDSAGIRVFRPGTPIGYRGAPGEPGAFVLVCPGAALSLVDSTALARNVRAVHYATLDPITFDSASAPAGVTPGTYYRMTVPTDPAGRIPPSFYSAMYEDSLGLFRDWRAAVPVFVQRIRRDEPARYDARIADSLAAIPGWRPRFGPVLPAAPLPPVVVSPPTPPVVVPPADPCGDGVGAWRAGAAVRGHAVTRRDEARVIATTGLCVGVVRVIATAAGDRFEAVYPPCAPGQPWRPFATRYTTRAGAIDRAARGGPACPAVRVPDARNLPAVPVTSRRS